MLHQPGRWSSRHVKSSWRVIFSYPSSPRLRKLNKRHVRFKRLRSCTDPAVAELVTQLTVDDLTTPQKPGVTPPSALCIFKSIKARARRWIFIPEVVNVRIGEGLIYSDRDEESSRNNSQRDRSRRCWIYYMWRTWCGLFSALSRVTFNISADYLEICTTMCTNATSALWIFITILDRKNVRHALHIH